MVDVIKLIRAVRGRQALWDRKHGYYHDRGITSKLWEEVAQELGVDSESARAKWKGLRDTFRGELKKVNRALYHGQLTGATNWEYFDEMLFVRDQIYSNKRSLQSILKNAASNESPDECPLDVSDLCRTEVIEGSEPLSTLKRVPADSDSESEPSLEKRLKTDRSYLEEDDDYSFLMSILPQLRTLPTTRNLFVRLKIQELLYNEIVALHTGNNQK